MTNHTPDPAGWGAYERLVLAKLEELSNEMKELRVDLNEEVKDIRKEQTKQDVAIAMLQVKAGLFGSLAGLVTLVVYIGYTILGGGSA